MKADLHIHSRCSDGSASVAAVMEYAHRAKLDCIALSDHDTMMGVEQAVRLGRDRGIQVIPAVEISTWDTKRSRAVHLLCYLPQRAEEITRFCNATLELRQKQKQEIVEKLGALYPIQWEDVLAAARESAVVQESHIMSVLADMGYTNSVIGPLTKELISPGGRCHVPAQYPSIMDALETVEKCGGVSVMAHPGQYDSLELAEELAAAGLLDGVEVWHPRNTPAVQSSLLHLAQRYDLLVTGGSDFHGSFALNPHPIGDCTCGQASIEKLFSIANSKNILIG